MSSTERGGAGRAAISPRTSDAVPDTVPEAQATAVHLSALNHLNHLGSGRQPSVALRPSSTGDTHSTLLALAQETQESAAASSILALVVLVLVLVVIAAVILIIVLTPSVI